MQVKESLSRAWRRTADFFNRIVHIGRLRWQSFAGRYPRLARWTRRLALVLGIPFAIGLIFLLIVLISAPTVRELQEVRNQVASEIYTADSLLLGRYFNQYRTVVKKEEIPRHVFDALVATEDARFYSHRGIDYRAWGRVLFRTIIRGDESGGGGSTISQQLAKNLFPRKDYGFVSIVINKVREMVIARRLERAYEKDELLTLYLNTVPFPDNVYGIEVASRRFFAKAPLELNIEEGAALVGTLRATTYYNPARYPERAEQRRNVVLSQMFKNQYFGKEALDSLQKIPLALNYDPVVSNEGTAPYFRAYMRVELEKILADHRKPDGEPYNLYTDGLKVYTTLHSGIQRLAEEAVREHLSDVQRRFDEHWRDRTAPWNDVETVRRAMRTSVRYQELEKQGLNEREIQAVFEKPVQMKIFTWDGGKEVEMSPLDSIRYHLGILQVGFIAIEPSTGFIRAWIGGTDFSYVQYDHVRARRQAGSVFKPVVYAQALRDSVEPCGQLPNQLLVYHEYAKGEWYVKDHRRDDPEPHFSPDGTDLDDWIPQNSDGIYGGSYSLTGALTNSVNTVTVGLIMRTGVKPVVELARAMGIESEIPVEPSIALGTAEVSLYEMIQPFATLANGGRRVKPIAISRIETYDGKVLVEFNQDTARQVIEPETANLLTHMLESVATYGTASRLRWRYGLYNIPIAGKTGTSQNHADGWFIGYTPKLLAGVWIGGDSPLVRFRNFENGQGAATALPVWAFFMRKVHDNNAFSQWHGGEFPPLTPEQRRSLACPMRIPSPEELLADSLLQDSLMRLEMLNPDLLEIDSLPPGG
jgi:penicillin-binding protein 1A